jgi:hypothetical protein
MKSEEYVYDVMPLRLFASLNIVSQMNKAVSNLLDILGRHEIVLTRDEGRSVVDEESEGDERKYRYNSSYHLRDQVTSEDIHD